MNGFIRPSTAQSSTCQAKHAGRWSRALLIVAATMMLDTAIAQDAVTHWSARSDVYVTGGPPLQARSRAMVQIAVHDALNAISPRYAPYTSLPALYAGGSPQAAVATATYLVLDGIQTPPPLSPALKVALKNEYDSYIATLDCAGLPANCIAIGQAAGTAAAQAIASLRAQDGALAPTPPYLTPPAAGVYQPTPNPAGTPSDCVQVPGAAPAPQFEQWADVVPFVLVRSDQFRSDPPPIFDLTSDEYTRDFEEVRTLGRCDAEATGARSHEQSLVARYMPAGGAPGPAIARDILAQGGYTFDLWQLAQLFALLNIAQADAGFSLFETKYYYRFWRPLTAIREAGSDGNPATSPDPAWLSYLAIPPYPDFVCGLTTMTGAATEVLRRWFGTDDLAWTRTVRSVIPGSGPDADILITRSYKSLTEVEREAVDARVFGGLHFRTGCVYGVRQGVKVGRFVFQHALKPLRAKR